MTDIAEHRCTEAGCQFVGQTPDRSCQCQCHKSREQMLMERVGELTPRDIQAIQYNGGNGDLPFVKIFFGNIEDAEAFHAALTKEPSV